MKEYPSIEKVCVNKTVYAFDKLDGSQIRAEWNKKKGFWKFGTRRKLLGESTDEIWKEAPVLIKEKYERDLHNMFVKERWQKTVCYFEFYGKNSFAGNHEDELHNVTLFDIRVDKKGILLPKDFLKLTKKNDIETAKLLYHGNANQLLVEQVRNGMLDGMTYEGVVCKAQEYRTPGIPFMFKIKNLAWLDRLKQNCNGDEKLFDKLA